VAPGPPTRTAPALPRRRAAQAGPGPAPPTLNKLQSYASLRAAAADALAAGRRLGLGLGRRTQARTQLGLRPASGAPSQAVTVAGSSAAAVHRLAGRKNAECAKVHFESALAGQSLHWQARSATSS
jgi:hypothetical protein